jgi:hypothetical protein
VGRASLSSRRPLARVLDRVGRVVQQRHEDLHELLGVAAYHGRLAVQLQVDNLVLEAAMMLQQEHRLLDDTIEIHWDPVTRTCPTEVQQRLCDALAAAHLGVDDAQVLDVLGDR